MSFSSLVFDNQYINRLPADKETQNFLREVRAAYSFVLPTSVSQPERIAVTQDLAEMLGFSTEMLNHDRFAAVFCGNQQLQGMQPYAMCYGGHQFGNWAGQLGDGRAINLGELATPANDRWTLQLKGAGPTAYSRSADGRAVLRSSVREFLCSEAMFHLGVPTTRALSLCLTGDDVIRDMFYDGHSMAEPGAIVCRVSRSFTRFGHFQLPSSRGDVELLRQMADTCIELDFPEMNWQVSSHSHEQRYLDWFTEVCRRTCSMIVHWMRVGFVHGVMNTDNMSILGETIDYGPYGWLDNFDPDWTPNTTDAQGRRYRYGAQPEISHWNLFQLANAIYPLIGDAEPLQVVLNDYFVQYKQQWNAMMAQKLGFSVFKGEEDQVLFNDLEALLATVETDMTIFYRRLAKLPLQHDWTKEAQCIDFFSNSYYQSEQLTPSYSQAFSRWLQRYVQRSLEDEYSAELRMQTMNAVNPKYVLRNYLAQEAIELAEQSDYSRIHELQKLLLKPYDEQSDKEQFAQKRPDWARHKAGCSMLSCSS